MTTKSADLINRRCRCPLGATAIVVVALIASSPLGVGEAIAQSSCATMENQLKALEASQAQLQMRLRRAAGEEKQSLVQQIRELESEIQQKKNQLNQKGCTEVTMRWTIAGEQREALVFPPAAGLKHPVVFAFHGHGGTMRGVAQQMHFQRLWRDAIVVYPQGLDTKTGGDPEGQGPGWQKEPDSSNRDLKFFDAMLGTLREKYQVDDERIYATGFSNGTGFSYLLWAERGDALAAIGAVSGVLAESERHKPMRPRALISIAGLNGYAPEAVRATIDRAKEIDDARGAGQECPLPANAPHRSACVFYQSVTQTPVKQITHPGGHVYVGWAPEEIVNFFKSHKRPGE